MAEFINPYTFVPFPRVADEKGFRRAPAGHAALGESSGSPRLVGQVEVTLTARSPLLVRDHLGNFPRRRLAGSEQPAPYLPGSALAGVVRSLHESLAGGCLRVFDEEYLPSYRDPVRSREHPWTLALVTTVRGDRPSELVLCDTVIRVRADALAQVLGGPHNVRTGSRVDVTGRPRGSARGLPVVRDAHDLAPGDGWVVLVTDSKARDQRRAYYCTVGQLSRDDTGRRAWPDEVSWQRHGKPAWDDMLNRIEDTDDMRRVRAANGRGAPPRQAGPVEAEVEFNGRLVGYRHEARRESYPGQVLWVLPTADGIAEFSLATVWRHNGAGPAGERVPGVLHACADPESLCPTCRIFGAVDTAGADSPEADQRGYRGHIRFSDAMPDGPVPALHRHQLAPLGRPRPGAGQFYLDNSRLPDPPRREAGPLREWGSVADRAGWRALRGRKHYWLAGDDHTQRPLFRVTDGEFSGEMAGEGEAVPAGTRFTFTVWFENLDTAELGGLLAALDPSAVLTAHVPAGGEVGFAVGGGRPFGFGTCTAQVTGLAVHTAASWYGTADPPDLTTDAALAEFRATVDRGVRAGWPALAAALHLDHVEQADVWYPPEKPLPAGPLHAEALAKGAAGEFWKRSEGYRLSDRVYPLVPLPDVTAADQHLPVEPQPVITGDAGRSRPRRGPGRGGRR